MRRKEKRQRGRPRIYDDRLQTYGFTLREDDAHLLKAYAKGEGMSSSEVLRMWIDVHLRKKYVEVARPTT